MKNMKQYISFFAVLLTSISIYAQKVDYYIVTSNNVVMRKGPGVNYQRGVTEPGRDSWSAKPYFNKGDILKSSVGKEKNGYVKIFIPFILTSGWVAKIFLTPAVKCKKCNGTGHLKSLCKHCNGKGYGYCCNYSGYTPCNRCESIGYHK